MDHRNSLSAGAFGKNNRLVAISAFLGLMGLSANFSFSQPVTTNAVDSAGNYPDVWTNGANGGTGFGPWVISVNISSNSFAGAFIGNPTNAGITSFGTQAFGLYANPTNTPATVSVDRNLSNALSVGQTLEFKWAVNFDSGNGNKGFNLYAGGPGTNEIVNVNQAGFPGNITFNGANAITNYGTGPMTWKFTLISSNMLRVTSSPRDGSTNIAFSNNISVSGAPKSFRFYATAMQNGDDRQPYFNDFLITSTTNDVTPPVISLATGVDKVTWVAKDGTVNPSNADVSATDNSGTSPTVTFSPASVNTGSNGITTVTYTATDSSSNTATVTRLIAVGNAAPGYHNLRFPAAMTINTLTSDFAYGEIYLDGATAGDGAASGIQAWVGVNTNNSDPATWTDSVWSAANYVGEENVNNDNYQGMISGTNRTPGTYFYATRFRLGTNPANTNFFYGGIGSDGVGGTWGGTRQVVVSGVTKTFTNGNGVLTVEQGRLVTYAVDMSVQKFKGLFNPSNHSLQVRTGMNTPGYAERALTNTTGDLYTGTFAIPGANESTNLFKFYAVGNNGLAWEDGAERQLVLAATNQNAGTNFFSNLLESRKISFAVDMSEQVTKLNFNPASDTVSLRIFTPGLEGDRPMSRVSTTSQYTYDWFFDGSMLNFPTNFAYKFFNNRTGAPNSGYEGGSNRNLAASDVSPGNLSTNTLRLVTFVDATPPGATFAGWSGGVTLTNTNLHLLTKYAIGGASHATNNDGVANVVSQTNVGGTNFLVLRAFVRTNDSKLSVEGEMGTNLVAWSTNGVTTNSVTNPSNAPAGTELREYRTAQDTNNRKFLRLKATLAP